MYQVLFFPFFLERRSGSVALWPCGPVAEADTEPWAPQTPLPSAGAANIHPAFGLPYAFVCQQENLNHFYLLRKEPFRATACQRLLGLPCHIHSCPGRTAFSHHLSRQEASKPCWGTTMCSSLVWFSHRKQGRDIKSRSSAYTAAKALSGSAPCRTQYPCLHNTSTAPSRRSGSTAWHLWLLGRIKCEEEAPPAAGQGLQGELQWLSQGADKGRLLCSSSTDKLDASLLWKWSTSRATKLHQIEPHRIGTITLTS